ncbi:phage tail assembly protein [Schinkia azotoformans]|uniref:phage tail assembly protein n=1 Tax=Schinkia azotoformans TaxID=1454 RepID=UPI002DBDEC28|nr:phage tail assembly protein [Schinkia azotoformans]MEC1744118.1 phage tail assembly protein [Schinkia azotoformans]
MEKITFEKPFKFEDKEYQELQVDLDSLTGGDLIDAEKEARLLGDIPGVSELSKLYLACVVAKASKQPVELIRALPAKEFTKATMVTQDFLL